MKELETYITVHLEKGFSPDEIEEHLMSYGWTKQEIEGIMKNIKVSTTFFADLPSKSFILPAITLLLLSGILGTAVHTSSITGAFIMEPDRYACMAMDSEDALYKISADKCCTAVKAINCEKSDSYFIDNQNANLNVKCTYDDMEIFMSEATYGSCRTITL